MSVGVRFQLMEKEFPLLEPAWLGLDFPPESQLAAKKELAEGIERLLKLPTAGTECFGRLGVECPKVPAVIWMMRAMVASNVLSRFRRDNPLRSRRWFSRFHRSDRCRRRSAFAPLREKSRNILIR
jgi:hypothetical protein